MSTRSVRRRMVDAVLDGGGRLELPALEAVLQHAERGELTRGEKEAILRPRAAFSRSRKLRGADISTESVRYARDVHARLRSLAERWGIALDLGGSVDAAVAAGPAAEPPAEPADPAEALEQVLHQGVDLGRFDSWELHTPGAELRFQVEVLGRSWPALHLKRPEVEDGDPRDLVARHRGLFEGVADLEGFDAAARRIVELESAWLHAEDTDLPSVNRRYALASLRRAALLARLRDLGLGIDGVGIAVNAVLIALRDDLCCFRSYDMEVGSHTNYWPYWDGYLDVLEKLRSQLPDHSAAAVVVDNRIADVLRRKTVFGYSRAIDEKNAEQSLGAVVCWRPPFTVGPGHRVSLVASSTPYAPVYERLSLPTSGLSGGDADLHGAPLFRDEEGLLRFDRPTAPTDRDRTGDPLPEHLVDHVQAVPTDAADLGLRRPLPQERLRRAIPLDWNDNGTVSVAPIQIGWWGHCHNEAPANAMGLDPKKGVTLYRADRALPAERAQVEYSHEDCWDLVGAFTADHEGERIRDPRTGAVSQPGYVRFAAGQAYRQTRVEQTRFVGNRNNGGHWFQFTPDFDGARRIRIDAEVTDIWGLEDPSVHYEPPLSRFRRDIEDGQGGFAPNPDWVESGMSDDDMIAVTAAGRRLSLRTRFITFDGGGHRTEQHLDVDLDPTAVGFVRLADEVESWAPEGGGRLVEHWYDPATRSCRAVEVSVQQGPDGSYQRTVTRQRDWPALDVIAVQETTYDSVAELDDFLVADLGLPFTFDTSSGQAVWNYPVEQVQRDVVDRVSRAEDGAEFTYTTYRLQYRTMGGPAGDVRYIIKRDALGAMVRAMALDPMPDFAYRNDLWVCAPVAQDVAGQPAMNLRAMKRGYLTGPDRRSLVPDLWERQAIVLYAALSDRTAAEHAWVFEAADGRLISMPDRARFDQAVAADLQLRAAEAAAQG